MALPLAAVAAGASGASGLLKFGMGLSDRKKSKKIRREAQRKRDANPYKTSTETLQALDSAKEQAAQTELPGQALLEEKIASGTAGSLKSIKEAATTPQDIVSGATDAYKRLYVDPMRDITITAAERRDANQVGLQTQLNRVGKSRDEEWNQNVNIPYQNAMKTAGALDSSGKQSIMGGVGDILGGAVNYAGSQEIGKDLTFPGARRLKVNPISNTNQDNQLIQYYG